MRAPRTAAWRRLAAAALVAALPSLAVADPAAAGLRRAALAGDPVRAAALLADGVPVDSSDPDGASALFARPPCDDPAVAEVLLAWGADVDRRNDLGQTPLWSAALLGHRWTVRVLLAAGADPDPIPTDGRTPLAMAVLHGHLATAALLADAGAAVDPQIDGAGRLLDLVAARSDLPAVRFLLARLPRTEAGEVQEQLDAALRTTAAMRRREVTPDSARVLGELLAAGADPGQPDQDGWTALALAARRGHPSLVETLLQAGAAVDRLGGEASRSTPLLAAAAGGREEAALVLLAAGADPEARNRAGMTPLMFAAHHGLESLARRLLAAGADPAAVSLDGKSPLLFAVLGGHLEVARALLEGGAPADRVEHVSRLGRVTALELVRGQGDRAMEELLLEHGAGPRLEADAGSEEQDEDGGHHDPGDDPGGARRHAEGVVADPR